jgi:CTP synthase
MPKFIFVTGGVLSGLGKGVLMASIGRLLASTVKCVSIKCDGYLNVDPGTMNPIEHGEVFVLDDGTECDMDFGHYERFMNVITKGNWNITMGKIFQALINKERKGEFLGKTVQFIPHVTNEIKDWIKKIGKESDAEFILVEIGGTVGDHENAFFLEAARQLSNEIGKENTLFIHLSYVPIPFGVHEQKTKPTQMSVRALNELGIWPEVVVCRASEYLSEKSKRKIALFCNVPVENVFTGKDVESIYSIPSELEKQGLVEVIEKKFNLKINRKDLNVWDNLAEKMISCKKGKKVTIGICGKYTALGDSYASIVEALRHSSANLNCCLEIKMIDTVELEKENWEENAKNLFSCVDGILVPGGFGNRGWEGKIRAIEYARKNKIPFLGICLGLQSAVIEFARNECKINADSAEMIEENLKANIITSEQAQKIESVICLMDSQKNVVTKGGTMRLGAYEARVKKDSIVSKLYDCDAQKTDLVSERHRHRYEVNPLFHKTLEEKGLILSGLSQDGRLVEFIELPENVHPYFVATQAHPELKSKLEKPSPLFFGFVQKSLELAKNSGVGHKCEIESPLLSEFDIANCVVKGTAINSQTKEKMVILEKGGNNFVMSEKDFLKAKEKFEN